MIVQGLGRGGGGGGVTDWVCVSLGHGVGLVVRGSQDLPATTTTARLIHSQGPPRANRPHAYLYVFKGRRGSACRYTWLWAA